MRSGFLNGPELMMMAQAQLARACLGSVNAAQLGLQRAQQWLACRPDKLAVLCKASSYVSE